MWVCRDVLHWFSSFGSHVHWLGWHNLKFGIQAVSDVVAHISCTLANGGLYSAGNTRNPDIVTLVFG
jgi:hypothetical protein